MRWTFSASLKSILKYLLILFHFCWLIWAQIRSPTIHWVEVSLLVKHSQTDFWLRIDRAFHSATHTVTRLPFFLLRVSSLESWPVSWRQCRGAGLEVSDLTGIWRRWRRVRATLGLSAKMKAITLLWHMHSLFLASKVFSEDLLSVASFFNSSVLAFFCQERVLQRSLLI